MSGEGQYGQWYLQNGVIKDDTGEIKVTFSGREEVPQDWRGKTVELKCIKGTKGGWSGVKRSVNKKDKADILHVSEKAEVLMLETEQVPEPEKPAQSPPSNGPAKAPSSPPQPTSDKGKGIIPQPGEYATAEAAKNNVAGMMTEAINQMYQLANCQYAAITVVHEYLLPLLKQRGITIDPVQETKLVQNMLIQSYYEKAHWKFPGKKLGVLTKQENGKKEDEEPPPG
jgi:hypothetical protein